MAKRTYGLGKHSTIRDATLAFMRTETWARDFDNERFTVQDVWEGFGETGQCRWGAAVAISRELRRAGYVSHRTPAAGSHPSIWAKPGSPAADGLLVWAVADSEHKYDGNLAAACWRALGCIGPAPLEREGQIRQVLLAMGWSKQEPKGVQQ